MILDLIVLGLVAIFCLAGALSGALRMGTRLLAAIGAGLLARPAGAVLAERIAPYVPLASRLAEPVAVALAGLGLYTLFSLFGRFIAHGMTEDREVRAADRSAGAVLGAMQALFLAWIAVSALVTIEPRIGVKVGGEQSLAARIARSTNFFD